MKRDKQIFELQSENRKLSDDLNNIKTLMMKQLQTLDYKMDFIIELCKNQPISVESSVIVADKSKTKNRLHTVDRPEFMPSIDVEGMSKSKKQTEGKSIKVDLTTQPTKGID